MNKEITDEMISSYINRTISHISKVKYFGEKLGLDLSDHDIDKFTDTKLVKPYVIFTWYKKHPEYKITDEIQKDIDEATLKHILTNEHHPEFWGKDKEKLHNFSRDDTNPNNEIINAEDMTEDAIKQMCCDWCAMSKELGGTPLDWAKNNINKRWYFTDKQIKLIYDTLNYLWS